MIKRLFSQSVWIFIAVFILTACDEGSPTPNFDKIQINRNGDFLVFGEIYGACIDDCRELYLLVDTAIYRDANDLVQIKNTTFRKQPLPYESYLFARPLLEVPRVVVEQSYNEEDLIDYIGDADSYVYGQRDGVSFELVYDAIDLDAPEELKEFAKQVQAVLNDINQ